MSGYESIFRAWWTHPGTLALPWQARYLWVHLMTSPDMHGITGTGQPSRELVRVYTGMPPKQLGIGWDALTAAGHVAVDGDWVWIPKRAKHHCHTTNHWQGVANHFLDPKVNPPEALIRDFLARYDRPELERLSVLLTEEK